ncbi:MAG TPA: hypothetical protein VF382_04325 [Actinomycetota bacterium]
MANEGELRRIDIGGADARVVKALEDALERAKRGEIRAVGLAFHVAPNDSGSAFEIGDNGDQAHLFIALEILKFRLLKACDED